MFFSRKRFIKISAYLIALLLFVLALISCSKLQSDVTSFSEKVKEKFQAKKKETVTASQLNLRKAPSTQSPTLSVLRKGDQLEIYHLSGKWAKVQTYDGSEGWVYTRYITGFEDLFAEKQDATETQQSTRRKADSGLEWLYGKVEIKSEPLKTLEYWIKEHDGRLWAITEVYPQTMSETAPIKLIEIRRSFSFGAEPKPDQ